MKKIIQALKKANNIVILTHANADGDTLGSARALCLGLRRLKKNVCVKNGDEINYKYQFLYPEEQTFDGEFVVALDSANPRMLGDALYTMYGDRIDMQIDHHDSNTHYAKLNYVEADSASCGEIVYALLNAMHISFTVEMARALYTAVSTDTGGFRHGNTTPRTHEIAAQLMRLAGDISDLNYVLFTEKSQVRLYLEQRVIRSFTPICDNKAILCHITMADILKSGGTKSDRDDLADLPRSIRGVKVGVLFKEEPSGAWRVSVRSNDKEIDASAICQNFGGGGHRGAAGCTIHDTLETAKKQFTAVLERML